MTDLAAEPIGSDHAFPSGDSQLAPDLEDLLKAARQARHRSYSPYSRFAVGAAVRTIDGRVFVGANVENASYGLTVCAERNAVYQAVLMGSQRVVAVAVCTDLAPPAAPCGMCRHTIAEFADDDCIVLLGSANPSVPAMQVTLGQLLPLAFRTKDLLIDFASQQKHAGVAHD